MKDLLCGDVRVRQRCGGLRNIGPKVLTGRLDLQPMSPEVCDRWSAALAHARMAPGQIEPLFSRADCLDEGMEAEYVSLCDPDHREAMETCLRGFGLTFDAVEPQALACLGAPFHHDGGDFTDQAFAVLWLSDDEGWDLVFPQVEGPSRRIEMRYGAVAVFDAAQPHGVVRRGAARYDDADFPVESAAGHYLSWDLSFLRSNATKVLGIDRCKSSSDVDGRIHLIEDSCAFEDYIDPNTGRWMGQRHADVAGA